MYMVGAIHYWTLFVGVLILYIQKCYIFINLHVYYLLKRLIFIFLFVCLWYNTVLKTNRGLIDRFITWPFIAIWIDYSIAMCRVVSYYCVVKYLL